MTLAVQHCTVSLSLCFVAHIILLNSLEAGFFFLHPQKSGDTYLSRFSLVLCLILVALTVVGYCSAPFVEMLSVFSSCSLRLILSIQNFSAVSY